MASKIKKSTDTNGTTPRVKRPRKTHRFTVQRRGPEAFVVIDTATLDAGGKWAVESTWSSAAVAKLMIKVKAAEIAEAARKATPPAVEPEEEALT